MKDDKFICKNCGKKGKKQRDWQEFCSNRGKCRNEWHLKERKRLITLGKLQEIKEANSRY